ncbi:MAG: hypothetical protein ABH863_05350 [Candidatus Micrarchaeota archaeon]
MARPGRLIWKDHLDPSFLLILKKVAFLSGTLMIFLFFIAATFVHNNTLLRVAVFWILLLGISYIMLNRIWRPIEVRKNGMRLPDMRTEYTPFRMLIAAIRPPAFVPFRDVQRISIGFDPFVVDSNNYITVKARKTDYYNILHNPEEFIAAAREAGIGGKILRLGKMPG